MCTREIMLSNKKPGGDTASLVRYSIYLHNPRRSNGQGLTENKPSNLKKDGNIIKSKINVNFHK